MFLREFETKLSELLKYDISIFINEIEVSKNEETIFSTLLKLDYRFIKEYNNERIDVIIRIKSSLLAYFSIGEFPKCCGKAVLYNIQIYKRLYLTKLEINNGKPYIEEMTDEKYDIILKGLIDLCSRICLNARYSSVDFIISQYEQPNIFNSLEKLGYKPVHQFKNNRMNNKNPCCDYIIDIKN